MTNASRGRVLAIDAYRGLVMLILVSDVRGGFSFYGMAERNPDSALWAFLARQFDHAPWAGATVWDLIMPSFVFLIGAAMPLSYAARLRRGDSDLSIRLHAALRVITLFILGLVLLIPIRSNVDFFMPFLILTLALPVPERVAARISGLVRLPQGVLAGLWTAVVLGAAILHLYVNGARMGYYDFANLLSQVALAYVVVFQFVNASLRTQAWTFGAILLLYWALFALYPVPAPGADLARLGVHPGVGDYAGFLAHWNMNTNVAADFDVWFLNLLPRPEPFVYNTHGYQTLNCIGTMATMLIGVMVGRLLQRDDVPRLRRRLVLAAAAGIVVALLAHGTVCPIVKSIWTSSWVLFSGGLVLLIFAALHRIGEAPGGRYALVPLAVAGSNSILLYVLASNYRWVVVGVWQRLFGADVFAGPYEPLTTSLAVVLALWAGTAILNAFGLRLRI